MPSSSRLAETAAHQTGEFCRALHRREMACLSTEIDLDAREIAVEAVSPLGRE